MKNLIPDYKEIDKIFIVSPINIREEVWTEFYEFIIILDRIIREKEKGQKIVIVCESENALNITKERFERLSIGLYNIEFDIYKVLDIWIRDYFSCGNIIRNDSLGVVKAIYSPSYNSLAETDDAAGILLSQNYFDNNIFHLPIKLDGGNVINNSDFVVISEKLYTENYCIGKEKIDRIFEQNFHQKLVTVPVEILDVVGHTDCILRFLDEKNILLPIYDSEYKVDNKYIMNIRKQLIQNLGIDYNFIFIPSYLDDKINDDNIFSAKGLYLNYFRFEDNIIFPSFNDLRDYEIEIARIFKKVAPQIKVYFSPCDNIAFAGGCWNCCTNVKFKI